MSRATYQRHRYLYDREYRTPLPRHVLLSQSEMVARIEAARLEDAAPVCPSCGCTAGHAVDVAAHRVRTFSAVRRAG